jgi:hypothetical protein
MLVRIDLDGRALDEGALAPLSEQLTPPFRITTH